MKLWFLTTIDRNPVQFVVVRAKNKVAARELAAKSPANRIGNIWLMHKCSTCNRIKTKGEAEVLVDFSSFF